MENKKKMTSMNELKDEQLESISGGTTTAPPQEAIDDGLYLGAFVANEGTGCDKCSNNQFQVTEFYPMCFTGTCTKCGTISLGWYKAYGGGWYVC